MGQRIIIVGAAGRDFHNFNTTYREDESTEVVCFTAAQIPDIAGRRYPTELAGPRYPDGIPIHEQDQLPELIAKHNVDSVVFSYSDVPYAEVMHVASIANAAGADFTLLSAQKTMLKSKKKIVSICAVRTGAGKSPTTRKVCDLLTSAGHKVVVIRHPMPYGDLREQAVQRFASYEDFATHKCTIEEREEYEPIVEKGLVVYAGVDYGAILAAAEEEADVVIWDGGNNDTSFYAPDVQIVIFDPFRPGHERLYYPGETNMRLADIAVISKVDTADAANIEAVKSNISTFVPGAQTVLAETSVLVDDPGRIAGKRVLVVEDGPTLTHGEMHLGAATIAARRHGAAEIVDPRPFAVGSICDTYAKFQHLEEVLPAMGYGAKQVSELEETINNANCDLVLAGTPIDIEKLLKINKPTMRVRYEYADHGDPKLEDELLKRL